MLLATLTLVHATLTSKFHVTVWLAAICSGTMNDIFFMVLPFVDNFWHAQGTVMLTPRLPLYIPCAYAVFQYMGVTASLFLPTSSIVSSSAAAALCGSVFYAAYDLVGAKYLWWTWHTTDAATLIRWCGVPIGSTMWTMVHIWCFSYILRNCKRNTNSMIPSIIISTFLTTPFMMLMMSPFQLHQIEFDISSFSITQFPGMPDEASISLTLAVLILAVYKAPPPLPPSPSSSSTAPNIPVSNILLWISVVIYFLTLTAVMALGDPTTVVATGLHQTIGDCDVKDYDLSGYERRKFLCNKPKHPEFKGHNQYFNVCGKVKDVDWFTVCGKPDAEKWVKVSIGLGVVGISLFGWLLLAGGNTKTSSRSKSKIE